ncbi:UDP-N-acetylglucosamine 2-epimerase (non-hydrolyzing) [bacterium]|nr:MAG: UDP-N-acetylglucosamine 2-epimerase (non-hydrolyzing) [bacterium]MCL4232013.1 UDP-N-acetylglucosamine 2-epimerase (non-hydrolyzing) [Dehalococcoidia bacterium]
MVVFGTRPEAIKMAPLVKELQRRGDAIRPIVCVTAQHRDMLDQVLGVFGIEPDHDLDLMRPDQTLPDLTARVLQETTRVLQLEQPDVVLVQGDTTTAMATALAAFYQRIPVGHVEAGLRTDNRYYPFPEEINRRLVTPIASFHFAPTQTALDALHASGVAAGEAFLTGNTVVDALLHIIEGTAAPEASYPAPGRRLVLVTAHRRENFGEPLRAICRAVRRVSVAVTDVDIVYPVHPNPNVAAVAREELDGFERVHLVPPLDYLEFVHLLNRSSIVLTDSGGVQEEAPALGKPVLVLRNETERPEGVAAGVAELVGPNEEAIVQRSMALLSDPAEYARMSQARSLYGDGTASQQIAGIILERLGA